MNMPVTDGAVGRLGPASIRAYFCRIFPNQEQAIEVLIRAGLSTDRCRFFVTPEAFWEDTFASLEMDGCPISAGDVVAAARAMNPTDTILSHIEACYAVRPQDQGPVTFDLLSATGACAEPGRLFRSDGEARALLVRAGFPEKRVELCELYPDAPRADALLKRAGFGDAVGTARPIVESAADYWREVFNRFDHGPINGGYTTLLDCAVEDYPANRALRLARHDADWLTFSAASRRSSRQPPPLASGEFDIRVLGDINAANVLEVGRQVLAERGGGAEVRPGVVARGAMVLTLTGLRSDRAVQVLEELERRLRRFSESVSVEIAAAEFRDYLFSRLHAGPSPSRAEIREFLIGVYVDQTMALELCEVCSFNLGWIPSFETPELFWSAVLRGLYNQGREESGVGRLIFELSRRHPGHSLFRRGNA